MSPALSHLHGVHSNIDTAVQQRVVNLLGEQTLATDVGQGLVQHLVAGGLHTPKGDPRLHETLVHPPAGAWSAIVHATAAHLDDVDLNSTVLAQLGEGLLRCKFGRTAAGSASLRRTASCYCVLCCMAVPCDVPSAARWVRCPLGCCAVAPYLEQVAGQVCLRQSQGAATGANLDGPDGSRCCHNSAAAARATSQTAGAHGVLLTQSLHCCLLMHDRTMQSKQGWAECSQTGAQGSYERDR